MARKRVSRKRKIKRSPRKKSWYYYKPRKKSKIKGLIFGSEVSIIIVILISALIIIGGYLWGIKLVGAIGDFWMEIKGVAPSTTSEIDKTPPSPPRLDALPRAVNKPDVEIKGFAENGSTVEIFLNDELIDQTTAAADTSFSLTLKNLIEGENKIYAVALDKSENQSQPSGISFLIYDPKPPKLELTEPPNGIEITDEKGVVLVQGKTEPEATVTINNHQAIVDSEGNFSYSLKLEEGDNKILAVATDIAGNQTKSGKTVVYKKEEEGE